MCSSDLEAVCKKKQKGLPLAEADNPVDGAETAETDNAESTDVKKIDEKNTQNKEDKQ